VQDVAVDYITLNYWGKHKRKMGPFTNRKATSSDKDPSL